MTGEIKISGHSASEYVYFIYSIGCKFNNNEPANYIFSKKIPNGNKYELIYIGSTNNINDYLSYQGSESDAKLKEATHIFVHLSSDENNQRINEERDLIKKYTPLNPMKTAKWIKTTEICSNLNIDTQVFHEQKNVYDLLQQKNYLWDVESQNFIYTAFKKNHFPTLDLEIQIRSSRPGKPSGLRLRHSKEKIFEIEKIIRQKLGCILKFYRRYESILYPPNSNDMYVWLHADIKDTVDMAYKIIEEMKPFIIRQIHQRYQRSESQSFIDLRFEIYSAQAQITNQKIRDLEKENTVLKDSIEILESLLFTDLECPEIKPIASKKIPYEYLKALLNDLRGQNMIRNRNLHKAESDYDGSSESGYGEDD